jgi:hypothetical protein
MTNAVRNIVVMVSLLVAEGLLDRNSSPINHFEPEGERTGVVRPGPRTALVPSHAV